MENNTQEMTIKQIEKAVAKQKLNLKRLKNGEEPYKRPKIRRANKKQKQKEKQKSHTKKKIKIKKRRTKTKRRN